MDCVRKQYHFRQSLQGLLARDVDRLITLSKPLPRKWVCVAELGELDRDLVGSGSPETHAKQYPIDHPRQKRGRREDLAVLHTRRHREPGAEQIIEDPLPVTTIARRGVVFSARGATQR